MGVCIHANAFFAFLFCAYAIRGAGAGRVLAKGVAFYTVL